MTKCLKIKVVRLRPWHAKRIAQHMRQADRSEAMALAGLTPEQVAGYCVRTAVRGWAVLLNGQAVVMFGVSRRSAMTDTGVPWLLATPEAEQYPVNFLRRCKPYLAEIQKDFPRLVNYVDVRNTTAMQWLRWLGFRIHDSEPAGPFGRRFCKFTLGE